MKNGGRLYGLNRVRILLIKKTKDGWFRKIKKSRLIRCFAYLVDLVKIKRLSRMISHGGSAFICANDLHEYLVSSRSPERVVYLESGSLYQKITDDGLMSYVYAESLCVRLVRRFMGFGFVDKNVAELFSAYEGLGGATYRVRKNTHEYKRSLVQGKRVGNKVYWVGHPFCDSFGVSLSDYVEYIRCAIRGAGEVVDNMVYAPHVGKESEETLEYIKKSLKCEIDDRKIPIEAKIAYLDEIPKMLVGPCSSSMINVAEMTDGRVKVISAWHYELANFGNLFEWKNMIKSTYGNMISFVEVSDAPSLFSLGRLDHGCFPPYRNISEWYLKSGSSG